MPPSWAHPQLALVQLRFVMNILSESTAQLHKTQRVPRLLPTQMGRGRLRAHMCSLLLLPHPLRMSLPCLVLLLMQLFITKVLPILQRLQVLWLTLPMHVPLLRLPPPLQIPPPRRLVPLLLLRLL